MSEEHERDNFEIIDGIGSTWAKALHKIGVHRFEDLARCTPQGLSKTLREKAKTNVPPGRIETKNWIGQARALAQQANTEYTPPEEQVEGANKPEKLPSRSRWPQRAGFSVYFEYIADNQDKKTPQTRVYHDESGEEVLYSGWESTQWVDWVLQRAGLLVPTEPAPAERKEPIFPVPEVAEKAHIQVLDVQISETSPSPKAPQENLLAQVHLRILGDVPEPLSAASTPFQVQVHAVELEGAGSSMVAVEWNRFVPGQLDYTCYLRFPVPDFGKYEIQTIVLLPSIEMAAFHTGPILSIVPSLPVPPAGRHS